MHQNGNRSNGMNRVFRYRVYYRVFIIACLHKTRSGRSDSLKFRGPLNCGGIAN